MVIFTTICIMPCLFGQNLQNILSGLYGQNCLVPNGGLLISTLLLHLSIWVYMGNPLFIALTLPVHSIVSAHHFYTYSTDLSLVVW